MAAQLGRNNVRQCVNKISDLLKPPFAGRPVRFYCDSSSISPKPQRSAPEPSLHSVPPPVKGHELSPAFFFGSLTVLSAWIGWNLNFIRSTRKELEESDKDRHRRTLEDAKNDVKMLRREIDAMKEKHYMRAHKEGNTKLA